MMGLRLGAPALVTAIALCAGCSFEVDDLVRRAGDDAGSMQSSEPDAADPSSSADASDSTVSVADASGATEDATAQSIDAAPSDPDTSLPDASPPPPVPAFETPMPYAAPDLRVPQDPTLTGDRLEMITNETVEVSSDLFVRTRTSTTATFSPPTALLALNTTSTERNPEISRDGLELWFISDRNGGTSRAYRCLRSARNVAWSAPEPIDFGLGPEREVVGATPSPDRSTLVLIVRTIDPVAPTMATPRKMFLARREGQSWSVTPVALPRWRVTSSEAGGMLDERGRLWFSSDFAMDGISKIYHADSISYASFADPVSLAVVNATAGMQYDPWISVNGSELFFTQTEMAGSYRLMHTTAPP